MSDDIKLLEELVVEAVDRLRDLRRERDGLREEVDSLRERLDRLERGADGAGDGSHEEQAWKARRAQALALVREALTELRGEGGAA